MWSAKGAEDVSQLVGERREVSYLKISPKTLLLSFNLNPHPDHRPSGINVWGVYLTRAYWLTRQKPH